MKILPKNLKKIAIITFLLFFLIQNNFVLAEAIDDLNVKIDDKKKEIDIIAKKIEIYKQKIDETRKESSSLKNELSILENDIAKLGLDIDLTQKQIQKTNLEIQGTNLSIKKTEDEIKLQKQRLSEYLNLINTNDQVSYMEIMLLNESFSDFFDHYKYLSEIQRDLYLVMQKLKNLKTELDLQKKNLEEKKKAEEKFKIELENKKKELSEARDQKEILIDETARSERKFQNYVYQLQLEQQQTNSEIITLEKKIREELEKKKEAERMKKFGAAKLSWPGDGRYLSAYFHDPDYPYRYIYEHPAIDIRTDQGTPVKAAEAGYVGKVKNGGAKGYSYIMIIHNDGISTVYGHVSKILTKEDEYVAKGQKIALSGGQPGTPGAGKMTTGPHLHFEVRLNGIPVNPLEYLPRDWE